MTPDRERDIERICQAALEREGSARGAYLVMACAGDTALQRDVESLLAQEPAAAGFMSTPAAALAIGIMSDGTSFIGRQLGPYVVQSRLGAGGMGEVYRAHDTKLGRDVAIKILPRIFTSDPERLARFAREARLLAALNHPNIGAIYGLEDVDGVPALVLELVEGDTLADRLAKGPLPIPDALKIAGQITDALEAAHERGIIHRDLKPANIVLRDLAVKVLDFGLAKLHDPNGSNDPNDPNGPNALSQSPTLTTGGTKEGVILGTVAYMSPEQARGKPVDKRADMWAFGCVLYEMLTGRLAFPGDTLSDTIASILQGEPDWLALPNTTPAGVRRLLRRCLEKDPTRRLRDIGDARLDLEEALTAPAQSPTVESASAVRGWSTRGPTTGRLRLAWAAAAGLLVASIVMAGMLMADRRTPETGKISFQVEISSRGLAYDFLSTFALSPDGKHLIGMGFSTRGAALLLRSLESLEDRTLFVTDPSQQGSTFPFWSPDGRFVAFFANKKLNKVDILGTPPQPLCDAPSGSGGAWNRAGVILFAGDATGPLLQVSDAGGMPVQATVLDGSRHETTHRDPYFLPDGKHFLYLAVSSKPENSGIYVGSLNSTERKRLFASTFKALFAAPEHILFMREMTLMAQRFDPERLELSGEPSRIADRVFTDSGIGTVRSSTSAPVGTVGFTVSQQGMLAYRTAASVERHLLWFSRAGARLREVGDPSSYNNPALSPDLQHVAVMNHGDISLIDLVRGGSSKFTFDPAIDDAPVWSPDGTRVVFQSLRGTRTGDLYIRNSSGEGQEELLRKSDYIKFPEHWSSDGRFLLYTEGSSDSVLGLWALPMKGDRRIPQRVVQSPSSNYHGRFSHDGRWIAYVSTASDPAEVYVQSFPIASTGSKWQVSTGGGAQPRWRQDGKELFFLSITGEAMAVDISTVKNGVFAAEPPRKLFQANPASVLSGRNSWDVTPNGEQFLVNSAGTIPPITVVVNWSAGLTR